MRSFRLTRRGLLKALPAIPLATKATAAELTGVSVIGDAAEERSWNTASASVSRDKRSKILDFFRKWGIPDWQKEQIRRRARNCRSVDIDIAVLKSVSLRHKLEMQWTRNEKRWMEEEVNSIGRNIARETWLKSVGLTEEDDYY